MPLVTQEEIKVLCEYAAAVELNRVDRSNKPHPFFSFLKKHYPEFSTVSYYIGDKETRELADFKTCFSTHVSSYEQFYKNYQKNFADYHCEDCGDLRPGHYISDIKQDGDKSYYVMARGNLVLVSDELDFLKSKNIAEKRKAIMALICDHQKEVGGHWEEYSKAISKDSMTAFCHRLKYQTEYQKDFETEALLARAVKQEGNTYTFLDMKLEPYTVKICPNESITFEDQIYKY